MRFGVLGPLSVWTVDEELLVVPEAKVRALLAALLVEPGRVISSDRLVEDLWGDRLPVRPARALQTVVSRLRGALAAGGERDIVVHRPPGYLLRARDDAVDAERFTSLAERARATTDPRKRAALFAEALAQWRGPAFDGFADEPFARAAVARLEEKRLLVWEEYAETRLLLGEYGSLAGELGELTERHPLRERLRAAHMRALHGAGRTSEALEVYQDLRRRLDEELGLEPGPALVALQRQVLRQAPAGPATAPTASAGPSAEPPRRRTNLPVPVTDLIGRSESVASVRALLAAERLVTLTGPGGVGKTRLALEIAHTVAESFPDGAWLVEFAGQARSTGPGAAWTVEGAAEVVAAALGIRDDARPGASPPDGPHPLADRLANVLRGRRLLLVLDNCEHVIDAVAGLAMRLLRAAPEVCVMATSREPLRISGERQWPVPPLDLPESGAGPTEVAQSSAVQLFVTRAATASPGFALSDGNAEAVATICRRMDGIPLALELASTRLRVLGAAGLAERLDDQFELLVEGRRDAPARQQTLRAVIDWSWDLLTAAERTVLRRLAIHSDGCALEAAEALCPSGGVKPAEVVDLLARLVDRSLVVVTHDASGEAAPRYRLLESVAAYCLERLRVAGGGPAHGGRTTGSSPDGEPASEYEGLLHAHARYYVQLAERADRHLRGGDQQRWLRRLDAEAANVRAALDTTAAQEPVLRRSGRLPPRRRGRTRPVQRDRRPVGAASGHRGARQAGGDRRRLSGGRGATPGRAGHRRGPGPVDRGLHPLVRTGQNRPSARRSRASQSASRAGQAAGRGAWGPAGAGVRRGRPRPRRAAAGPA